MDPIIQLGRLIGEFQHRNDSIHRHHDLAKPICSYCDLVGHYAVTTLLKNRELALAALTDSKETSTS
jgi:hypothetical protein